MINEEKEKSANVCNLENSRKYEEAIKNYDNVLELTPDYAAAWYHKGSCLSSLKRFQQAISSYDKAIEIEPNNANTWYNKGCSLAELDRYGEALSSYDKALEIEPSHNQAKTNRHNIVSNIVLSHIKYNPARLYHPRAIFSRKNYECDICKERFKTTEASRQHILLEHGLPGTNYGGDPRTRGTMPAGWKPYFESD